MILEAAVLNVKPGQSAQFEAAFREASAIIAASPGYIDHQLQRCLEVADKYLLLVRWGTLEDHTEGFRGSAAYGEWRRLLHHFYEPFPIVEHFTQVPL
jgi:heme-degrading monooxygenase HmoA